MKRFALALAVLASGSSMAFGVITIETVPVGDVGNLADTAARSGNPAGQGSVGYAYSIGKYEVTAGQYTAFLNAVAKTDAYGLYNSNQADTAVGSGISRAGSSGSYAYTVNSAFVNRPVNYVSFWDSARFTNWLHNGQPSGLQTASTTEDGAYTLTSTGITNNTITRNAGWTWAVTSEDEWYKAAYYKAGSTNAGYWNYPTQSNSVPGNNPADPSGNNANYFSSAFTFPIQTPFYTTVVGEYQNSASPYGTFDQVGNVSEWNDNILPSSYRGVRGGSFADDDYVLSAEYRNFYYMFPTDENSSTGFRVSQIPEPSSIAGLGMMGGLMLSRRRRVET